MSKLPNTVKKVVNSNVQNKLSKTDKKTIKSKTGYSRIGLSGKY